MRALLTAASCAGSVLAACCTANPPPGPAADAEPTVIVLTPPTWSGEELERAFGRSPDQRMDLEDGGEELVWRWPGRDGARPFELAFRFDAQGRFVSVHGPAAASATGGAQLSYTLDRGAAPIR